MVFIRAFLRGLLLFIALLSVGLWVVAATLQSTILNRDAVKQWGAESGAYANVMETLEIRQGDATGFIEDATLRQAINETLPPAYIQEQSEVAVDAFYDWVEGEVTDVTYTIPLHEQRDEFIANLAGALDAKISGLPECTGTLSLEQECIPRAYTTETYATTIAEQTADDSDLFEEAIVVEAMQPTGVVAMLPTLANWAATASWLLPIVVVLTGVGYVLLSRKWRVGMANLGKRFVFSSVLLVVLGVLAWFFGGALDLGARLFGGSDTSLITGVVEPVLNQAIPAIGMWLAIWSGCVLVLGIMLWVVGFVLQRGARGDTGVALEPTSSPASPQPSPPQAAPVVSTPKPVSSPKNTSSSMQMPSLPKQRMSPSSSVAATPKPTPSQPNSPSPSASTPPVTPPRSTTGSVSSRPRPESSRPPRRPISF